MSCYSCNLLKINRFDRVIIKYNMSVISTATNRIKTYFEHGLFLFYIFDIMTQGRAAFQIKSYNVILAK